MSACLPAWYGDTLPGLPLRHLQLPSTATHLGEPTARDLFEKVLDSMRTRYDFVVAGNVVRPEHVHLLLSEPKLAILAKALQALNLSAAVQSRERPLWQARYYDFHVFSEYKRSETMR